MLPDTMAGGLMLTVVNMAAVFTVLSLLGLIIKTISAVTARKKDADIAVALEAVIQRSAMAASSHPIEEGDDVSKNQQKPAVTAAVMAAIAAYMASPGKNMFLRDEKGRGAWGRLGRKIPSAKWMSWGQRSPRR